MLAKISICTQNTFLWRQEVSGAVDKAWHMLLKEMTVAHSLWKRKLTHITIKTEFDLCICRYEGRLSRCLRCQFHDDTKLSFKYNVNTFILLTLVGFNIFPIGWKSFPEQVKHEWKLSMSLKRCFVFSNFEIVPGPKITLGVLSATWNRKHFCLKLCRVHQIIVLTF